jgi:hypothetical protein
MLDLKLRDEFLGSQMPHTAIALRRADHTGAAQRDPNFILSITYPTGDVRTALRAIGKDRAKRHVAQPGDLLMVDEHELNLHPDNQRRIARLFAKLLNLGVKVFITTHSDYLIKELNTLIMLNHDKPYLKRIMDSEGYKPHELLAPSRVKAYIAEEALVLTPNVKSRKRRLTLTPADIDPELGIEARSFDGTIAAMNSIQERILFGEEDAA